MAALIADACTLALVNLIRPYGADRAKMRTIHERGLGIEIRGMSSGGIAGSYER